MRPHDTSEFEHPNVVERELLTERIAHSLRHLGTLRVDDTQSASLTTNEILRKAPAYFAQAELEEAYYRGQQVPAMLAGLR